MVDRFMSIDDVLFDATSTIPIMSKSRQMLQNIGIKEGMDTINNQLQPKITFIIHGVFIMTMIMID